MRDKFFVCSECESGTYPEFFLEDRGICIRCHKDKVAQYSYSRRSTPEKREAWNARNRAWCNSPEGKAKIKARHKIYYATKRGRDAHRRASHARRARIANAPSDNWKASEVHSEANGRCLYCGVKVDLADMHADHFIPLSKGGSNLRENIVCSCASCNLKKSDKMPEDFIGETL